MQREEFLSTNNLEKAITNRKRTICGRSFSWLNIRWLRFQRTEPLLFQFKETLDPDAEFYKVNLSKKRTGKPLQNLLNINQDKLYPSRRIVTEAKKKDMMDLLPFIPPVYHQFYRNLPLQGVTRSLKINRTEEDRESNDEMTYS